MKKRLCKTAPNPVGMIRAVVSGTKGNRYSSSLTKTSDHRSLERDAAYRYRAAITTALLKAHRLLRLEDFDDFLQQAATLTSVERNRFAAQSIDYDYVSTLVFAQAIPFANELLWIARLVRQSADVIARHLDFVEQITRAVCTGRSESSLTVLTEHEDLLGHSLWSVELRFALLQWTHGNVAQKDYLAHIKRITKHGMMPFLATYWSQRAESGVSISWFLDTTSQRADRLQRQELVAYTKYRLLGELPRSYDNLSSILRIEQNHHIVDMYETMLDVLQFIAANESRTPSDVDLVNSALNLIAKIPDYRISKLKGCLVPQEASQLRQAPTAAGDALLAGNVGSALRHALNELQAQPDSIFAAICLGAAHASHTKQRLPPLFLKNRLHRLVVNSISFALRREDAAQNTPIDSLDSLAKFSHVFSSLSYGKSLKHFLSLCRGSGLNLAQVSLTQSALNTKEVSPLDWLANLAMPPQERAPLSAFARIYRGIDDSPTGLSIDPDAESYARAVSAVRKEDWDVAEKSIDAALKSASPIISSHSAVVALTTYAATGALLEACRVLSREASGFAGDNESLPVAAVFEGIEWSAIEPTSTHLEVSNALLLYARVSKDERIHSYRSFALQRFLRAAGVDRPSMLRDKISLFPRAEIGFFLGKVCTLPLLDMVPTIESSREVLEERRDICALLVNASFDTMGQYRTELLDVSRELTVQRGLQSFDGSRVHVDTDALRSSVKRDLAESFNRYLLLTKNDPSMGKSFETVLKDLTRRDSHPRYLLTIPQDEASELLVSMILRSRQRFLFDVPHGLDSYLSKRVRHGSIVGYLRAPVEREGLITQRTSEGDYRENERWISANDPPKLKKELDNAFASFSKTFDQHLIRLKDVLLHVRSETHPLGVFDAPLSAPTYHLIRSVAVRDGSLETFTTTIFAALWGLLNPSLHIARELIAKETLTNLVAAFDVLRKRLAELLPLNRRTDADNAAGRASAAVQAAISHVSGWFEPMTAEDCIYSMEEVKDIAVKSVQSIFPTFSPPIDLRDPQGLRISSTNLPILLDIFFIAFGNIAQWSGRPNDEDVCIDITHDGQKEALRLRFQNKVVQSQQHAMQLERVESRRRQISTLSNIDLARKEGGSGLAKLASIVGQTHLGNLDFGYGPNSTFFLDIELSIALVPLP